MDGRDFELGDPLISVLLNIKFGLLEMKSELVPKDLADMPLEEIHLKVKKMLPRLKEIHDLLSEQAATHELLAPKYAEVTNFISEFNKGKARWLIVLNWCRAQLTGDDALEKHWTQMLLDSWGEEVPPVITREYLLDLRGKFHNWGRIWSNSLLLEFPNFSRRMEANSANLYAFFTEQLPMADLAAKGLEVDKSTKAATLLRYGAAPIELSDTMVEAFEHVLRAITTSKTKLQDMQRRYEQHNAELATITAHVYERAHAKD